MRALPQPTPPESKEPKSTPGVRLGAGGDDGNGGSGDDSSVPPPANGAATKHPPSMRSTLALVTAITGLVSAIAAFRHVPEEKTAKESYVVLQRAFEGQQAEVEGLKKDVLSMRSSFEAYVRAKEGDSNVMPRAPLDSGHAGIIPPVEVRVAPTPSSATTPAREQRVILIPSARPSVAQYPLPNVHEVEAKAKAKD